MIQSKLLMNTESAEGLVAEAGVQVSLLGDYAGPDSVVDKVDAVTVSQVNRVAKKVFGGPKSLAVVGNTSASPYLSEL